MLKRASSNWYIYFNGKQQLIPDTGVSKTKTIYSVCLSLTLL